MTLIDNAVYVKGTAPPIRAVWRKPTRCCGTATGWPGSGCTGPTWRRSGRWPPSSSCTSCRCRTRLRRISGPKLERYGPTLFVVLLPARYLDDVERVGCGELHLFVGVNFVITIPGGHRVPAGHPPVAGHVGPRWNTGSTSTVATSSCAVTCGTWPTTSHGWWNGGCVPGVSAERADGDRRAGRATAGRGDADVDRGRSGAERGGQRISAWAAILFAPP